MKLEGFSISSMFFSLQFFLFRIVYKLRMVFNFIPNQYFRLSDLISILLITISFILHGFCKKNLVSSFLNFFPVKSNFFFYYCIFLTLQDFF